MIKGKIKLRGGNSDFETIPEGLYTLQILDVDAVEWSYKGQDKEGFNFKFAILDEEELPESGESTRGRFLWWRVSNSLNKRSNLFKLATAALGRKLTEEETDVEGTECLDLNDLVGLQLIGMVANKEDAEGRVWSNIGSVSKAKTKLDPVEYVPEEVKVVKTKTSPIEEEDGKEEEDDDIEEILENPILKEIKDEIEYKEEDKKEEEDDDEEEELAKLELAAEKAKLKLAKLKLAKKASAKKRMN